MSSKKPTLERDAVLGLSGGKYLSQFPWQKSDTLDIKINPDNIIRLQFVPDLLKTVPEKKIPQVVIFL